MAEHRKIAPEKLMRMNTKFYHFPISDPRYSLIWKEFEAISEFLCGENGEPKYFKKHVNRRLSYMLRRMIVNTVKLRTSNPVVKEAVESIEKDEMILNGIALKEFKKIPLTEDEERNKETYKSIRMED